MSEIKFTKGSWVAFYPHEILNSGHVSVETELGQHIYTVEVYKSNLEEQTANANLIAAAPEMYSLLEKISVSMECFHGVDTNEINILLAKARGEL